MRVLVMSLIVFFNFILQTTWFQAIEIFGVKPNTAVLIIVCYAILRGDVEGSILGFFTGLLHDMFFARYLGFFALQGALIGYFCGKPFKDFFRENYLIPLGLAFVAMLFYSFSFYIVHFLLLARIDFMRYAREIILPEVIYTVALAMPLYLLLYKVNKKLENYKRNKI